MVRKSDSVRAASRGTGEGFARVGTEVAAIKQAVLDNLHYVQGRLPAFASRNDWYMAVSYTVRDRMHDRSISTLQKLAALKPL
jgi:glucan phosphorylase